MNEEFNKFEKLIENIENRQKSTYKSTSLRKLSKFDAKKFSTVNEKLIGNFRKNS